MSDFWFEPKDFWPGLIGETPLDQAIMDGYRQQCAKDANARLKAEREKAPVVFSSCHDEPSLGVWRRMGMAEDIKVRGELWFEKSTHRARLEGMEKIP